MPEGRKPPDGPDAPRRVLALARAGNVQAVTLAMREAPESLFEHLLTVLSAFPETTPPESLQHLLPAVGGDGDDAGYRERVAAWYRARALEIDERTGLAGHALALAALAVREKGVTAVAPLLASCATYADLVYNVLGPSEQTTLAQIEALRAQPRTFGALEVLWMIVRGARLSQDVFSKHALPALERLWPLDDGGSWARSVVADFVKEAAAGAQTRRLGDGGADLRAVSLLALDALPAAERAAAAIRAMEHVGLLDPTTWSFLCALADRAGTSLSQEMRQRLEAAEILVRHRKTFPCTFAQLEDFPANGPQLALVARACRSADDAAAVDELVSLENATESDPRAEALMAAQQFVRGHQLDDPRRATARLMTLWELRRLQNNLLTSVRDTTLNGTFLRELLTVATRSSLGLAAALVRGPAGAIGALDVEPTLAATMAVEAASRVLQGGAAPRSSAATLAQARAVLDVAPAGALVVAQHRALVDAMETVLRADATLTPGAILRLDDRLPLVAALARARPGSFGRLETAVPLALQLEARQPAAVVAARVAADFLERCPLDSGEFEGLVSTLSRLLEAGGATAAADSRLVAAVARVLSVPGICAAAGDLVAWLLAAVPAGELRGAVSRYATTAAAAPLPELSPVSAGWAFTKCPLFPQQEVLGLGDDHAAAAQWLSVADAASVEAAHPELLFQLLLRVDGAWALHMLVQWIAVQSRRRGGGRAPLVALLEHMPPSPEYAPFVALGLHAAMQAHLLLKNGVSPETVALLDQLDVAQLQTLQGPVDDSDALAAQLSAQIRALPTHVAAKQTHEVLDAMQAVLPRFEPERFVADAGYRAQALARFAQTDDDARFAQAARLAAEYEDTGLLELARLEYCFTELFATHALPPEKALSTLDRVVAGLRAEFIREHVRETLQCLVRLHARLDGLQYAVLERFYELYGDLLALLGKVRPQRLRQLEVRRAVLKELGKEAYLDGVSLHALMTALVRDRAAALGLLAPRIRSMASYEHCRDTLLPLALELAPSLAFPDEAWFADAIAARADGPLQAPWIVSGLARAMIAQLEPFLIRLLMRDSGDSDGPRAAELHQHLDALGRDVLPGDQASDALFSELSSGLSSAGVDPGDLEGPNGDECVIS